MKYKLPAPSIDWFSHMYTMSTTLTLLKEPEIEVYDDDHSIVLQRSEFQAIIRREYKICSAEIWWNLLKKEGFTVL